MYFRRCVFDNVTSQGTFQYLPTYWLGVLKCFVVLLKCLLNEWSYKLIVILNVGSVVMMILFKPMNNVVSFVLELFFANRIVNKKAFTFILSKRLL